ncbi:hypothetical protein SAMN02745123_03464, partial [Desulforamulus aeronauticus DSM 10349]
MIIRLPTISLIPIGDAYIAQSYPTTNFGSVAALYIGSFTRINDVYRSLIQFPTPIIPAGNVLNNAFLRLYLYRKDVPGVQPIYIYRVNTPFNQNTVTWNNRPVSSYTGNFYNFADDQIFQFMDIDVTELVNGWINGDYPNFGLEIRGLEDQPALSAFRSSDYSDSNLWPRLIVTYTNGPSGPTGDTGPTGPVGPTGDTGP